jgi:hypothetical protein
MNIDKALKWLDENKGSVCTLNLKKDISGKLDGKVIAFCHFDNYEAYGDWENPVLAFKNKNELGLNVFLYDIQRFTVKNKELNFYIGDEK